MRSQALYQVTVLLVLHFDGKSIMHYLEPSGRDHAKKEKNTIIFNAFVLCQVSLLSFFVYFHPGTKIFFWKSKYFALMWIFKGFS